MGEEFASCDWSTEPSPKRDNPIGAVSGRWGGRELELYN